VCVRSKLVVGPPRLRAGRLRAVMVTPNLAPHHAMRLASRKGANWHRSCKATEGPSHTPTLTRRCRHSPLVIQERASGSSAAAKEGDSRVFLGQWVSRTVAGRCKGPMAGWRVGVPGVQIQSISMCGSDLLATGSPAPSL
jgi:hypothetical protein